MSKFRVEIDVSFDSEQDAIDFLNHVEDIKVKSWKPAGTEKINCYQKCRYHECFHDEDPPKQCGDYVNVDFSKDKEVYTVKQ